MAVYTIIRIYEIPANDQIEAADRMLEAIVLHAEKDYHKKDIVREPGSQPGEGKPVTLQPAPGWMVIIRQQLGIAAKK